jgi:hypothetical protein
MTRLEWDSPGNRYFEAGLDRGVLYVPGFDGVPWNGLTGVAEKPSGAAATPYYVDGYKYLNEPSLEEFLATITAFTYPDEFMACDGTVLVDGGLYVMHQQRSPFSFTYRTKVGNDVSGTNLGYKIHLVYNAIATPSQRANASINNTVTPLDFSWDITVQPPAIDGFSPSGHMFIDSRIMNSGALSQIEDILYGTDSAAPRMPDMTEIVGIIAAISPIILTDNGDGTWTLTADDYALVVGDGSFTFDSNTVTDNGDGTFTIVSA